MKFPRLAIFVLVIVLILALAAVSVGRQRRNSALSKRPELYTAKEQYRNLNLLNWEDHHGYF